MQIEIPDEIAVELRLPPDRAELLLKQELAVQLVRESICTAAQGARLAELSRLLFERLLGQRGVSRTGTIAEVQRDVETLEAR